MHFFKLLCLKDCASLQSQFCLFNLSFWALSDLLLRVCHVMYRSKDLDASILQMTVQLADSRRAKEGFVNEKKAEQLQLVQGDQKGGISIGCHLMSEMILFMHITFGMLSVTLSSSLLLELHSFLSAS